MRNARFSRIAGVALAATMLSSFTALSPLSGSAAAAPAAQDTAKVCLDGDPFKLAALREVISSRIPRASPNASATR